MEYLFDEFKPVSPTAWKQKIQVDLKGADYNDTLLWHTDEGITVKPFYTSEDRSDLNINLPDSAFNICQSFFVHQESIANDLAKDALKRGATAIQFIADSKFDIQKLLNDINAEVLYFKLQFLDASFVKDISLCTKNIKTYFQIDPLGHLAETGNWFQNQKNDYSEIESILRSVKHSLCVDGSLYQNAGANMTQQLAYMLAQTNEYLTVFGSETAKSIHFKLSVGSNYFFEIAKLKAFRVLLDTLYESYGIENHIAHIYTTPSVRNKTLYDYNVNMLRTTSECMSAALGGSNSIGNLSYDYIFHKSNEFGERISRNQLLILQEESYLSDAHKISEGAYYIDAITVQLAERSLSLLKQIEKSGGFLKQLFAGNIQKKIKEQSEKEQEQFNTKKLVLLGTNKLQNDKDQMKNDLEIYPFLKKNNNKTLIPPILKVRLSESLEQERLKKE